MTYRGAEGECLSHHLQVAAGNEQSLRQSSSLQHVSISRYAGSIPGRLRVVRDIIVSDIASDSIIHVVGAGNTNEMLLLHTFVGIYRETPDRDVFAASQTHEDTRPLA